jgi:hypothetical protein
VILQPITRDAARYVALRLRAADRREIFATRWDEDPEELAAAAAVRGPFAWAAGAGGEPIACIGALEMWPGVWEAWMFATDAFNTIGKPLTRFIRQGMIPALTGVGAHRVQCHSIEGHHHAHRWLERLGAMHEFTVPRYGKNGEAFRLYSWSRGAA